MTEPRTITATFDEWRSMLYHFWLYCHAPETAIRVQVGLDDLDDLDLPIEMTNEAAEQVTEFLLAFYVEKRLDAEGE